MCCLPGRRRAPLPRAASVPIRDESGRFAGVREKTAEEKTRGGGGLFKSTAVQVLRTERRLLTTGSTRGGELGCMTIHIF